MDRWDAAARLREIAQYLELTESNRFKPLAYEKAARALESFEGDLDQLVAAGELGTLSGIGKAIGPVIKELLTTGESQYLAELREQFPPGIFDLLRVPHLGLKKIGQLHQELGISSIEELEAAAANGRLAKVKGFGAKTAEKILSGIEWARTHRDQYLLPDGMEIATLMEERLGVLPGIDEVLITGSIRRKLEVISNVNILVLCRKPASLLKRVAGMLDGGTVDGHVVRGKLHEMPVWVHAADPKDSGAALAITTGSAEFVTALAALLEKKGLRFDGLTLRRGGKRLPVESEEALFRTAGVPVVAPERREDAADLKRKTPRRLIEREEIRGTFHVHTTWSDGRDSVHDMLAASQELGFEYVGISDHSPTASYAGGLTVERLREQQADIAREETAFPDLRVFRGTEADILSDGSIDYPQRTLARFDFVIASVHSKFSMPPDEMTERLLTALDHPAVTFLGHMTGRLLLSRKGYSFDFDRVFERAGKRGVMIEINSNPHRAEIDWRLISKALDYGVLFSINPDAHSTRELRHIETGCWIARKGGLSSAEVFNTLPADAIAEFFEKRRKLAS